jgi:hypothetical protein
MFLRSSAVVALALVPTALLRPAEEIAFHPKEGLALSKTFHSSGSLELESASLSFNGQEHDVDQTRSFSAERKLVVTDHYKKVDGDKVLALERSYDDIDWTRHQAFSMRDTKEEIDSEASCDLVGETVLFTWDADEEAYVASDPKDQLDVDLLEDLVCELDFTALLPGKEVSTGDTWNADLEAFQKLLNPLNDLPVSWEHTSASGRDIPDTPVRHKDDEDKPDLDGEVTVELAGFQTDDGPRLAILKIRGEVTVTTAHDESNDDERGSQEMHTEITETFAIEGQALWDVAAGHFQSWELSSHVERHTDSQGTMHRGEREFTRSQQSTESGTFSYDVTFEGA